MKLNKAAMFGLDARIALAIFGALSVISGAALYSAIENARTTRYWQDFQEFVKASEQYYLDTGKTLPQYTGGSFNLYMSDLVENRESLSTWKGPYITGSKHGNVYVQNSLTKDFSVATYMDIVVLEGSTWTTAKYDECTVGAIDCVEWIGVYIDTAKGMSKAKKLFASLDEKIDNKDGIKAGSVRMYDSGTLVYLFIKGIPHKKTT